MAKTERFVVSPIRCYYDLELPKKSAGSRAPLLIALHGFRGNKDSMFRLARRIGAGRMIVISLQGPYQFYFRLGEDQNRYNVGFGWGTIYKMQESIALHHRNLRLIINTAARKFGADRRRVFLLGFSQACAYNYRFAFTYPRTIRAVIAVCGGVPRDWEENPRYRPARTHVLHIAATRDEWYSPAQNLRFRRQLARRAARLDFRIYNSSHRFPRAAIPYIRKWIEQVLASRA